MGQFLDLYRKQGGAKLLREFWDNGALGYALCQMLLLGKSKKALEILRLGVQLKTQQKIEKEFLSVLKDFDKQYCQNPPVSTPGQNIWMYWNSGIDNAPPIVKHCYESIKANTDRPLILLTGDNYKQYVTLPDYIESKHEAGLIGEAHFSDILRIELLAKYGGTWIDATVLCVDRNIPAFFFDSEFFVFQKLKPGLDGHTQHISNWFITAWSNQKFILAQQALLRNYWRRYDKSIQYFFFHHFFTMISHYYQDDWKKVIQFPNSFPHILLLMLFDPFDSKKWDALRASCPFQKLSYKFDKEKLQLQGTYYQHIMSAGHSA